VERTDGLSENRNDYQDPVLDDEVHLGFKSFITDAWTFLDMINYALFLMFIVIRVSLITMILNKDNAVKGVFILRVYRYVQF